MAGPIYNFLQMANYGPMYQIPSNTELFDCCIKNFDYIFEKYRYELLIFKWSGTEARFYKNVLGSCP